MTRFLRLAAVLVLLAACTACDLQQRETAPLSAADREAALRASLRLIRSPDPSERVAGARELGRAELADARAFLPLCRLLHDDPEPMVRRHAAFALRAAAYAAATTELVDCIHFDRDQAVRSDALRALGFRRDPAALPHLEIVLGNRRETPAFREEVVKVLGRYRSRDADRLLCRAAVLEHSAGPVREQALDQLAEQGYEAVPVFLDYLREQGFTIAGSVVEEMRREDPDGAMPRLVRAYRQKVRAGEDSFAQRGQLFP